MIIIMMSSALDAYPAATKSVFKTALALPGVLRFVGIAFFKTHVSVLGSYAALFLGPPPQ